VNQTQVFVVKCLTIFLGPHIFFLQTFRYDKIPIVSQKSFLNSDIYFRLFNPKIYFMLKYFKLHSLKYLSKTLCIYIFKNDSVL